jgi:hypothetical protein
LCFEAKGEAYGPPVFQRMADLIFAWASSFTWPLSRSWSMRRARSSLISEREKPSSCAALYEANAGNTALQGISGTRTEASAASARSLPARNRGWSRDSPRPALLPHQFLVPSCSLAGVLNTSSVNPVPRCGVKVLRKENSVWNGARRQLFSESAPTAASDLLY